MLSGIHLGIGRLHPALLIDQIADAIGVSGLGIGAGAVREAEPAIDIAQQFVGEIEFLGECRVRIDTVEAYAENHDAILLEIGMVVAEPATFDRSARGIGLGVEPEQHLAAA